MMKEYHKIQTLFKRDPDTKFRTLLDEYALEEFAYLKDNQWEITEKVDGTNIRVHIEHGKVTYGGRTEQAQIPAKLIAMLNEHFLPRVDLICEMFDGVTLYGEGYGDGIQKAGKHYRPDQSFVLFDVLVGPWWLKRADVNDVAKKLDLLSVPVIGTGDVQYMVSMVRGGFGSQWGDFPAEGIVARPTTELKTRSGHRLITKLKTKDFAKTP